MFKAITGCDRITAEFKYRDSFEFTPFARLLFSANRLPPTDDASLAFFDRWLIVPFPNRFRHTGHETPRSILQRRLCSRLELSGALNKALEALQRVRLSCRFTEPAESHLAVKTYQAANDTIAAWLDEHTTISGDAIVLQSELHAAYTSHCRRCGRRPASKQAFGRLLREVRPEIKPTQRTVAGRRTWVYAGIALRDAAECSRARHREPLLGYPN
jgi:putative DNA primase/helicase